MIHNDIYTCICITVFCFQRTIYRKQMYYIYIISLFLPNFLPSPCWLLILEKKRKQCKVCSSKVRTWCSDCQVGLCVGCFETYHTRERFEEWIIYLGKCYGVLQHHDLCSFGQLQNPKIFEDNIVILSITF